jgi:SAM-dependent methyltransferase
LLLPRDAEFGAESSRIHAERSDLRQLFRTPDEPGFRRWIAANGPLEYPERLGRFFPPVPPPEVRLGCGGSDPQSHLYTSVSDFMTLAALWETFSGRVFGSLSGVYDFGSSCGRVMRWFGQALGGESCFGTDVNRPGVEWCQAHLPGSFQVNSVRPPLPFPDAHFDLVYSLSVFTHLNQEACDEWIAELTRVTRPGGLMLVSVCGSFALWVVMNSAEHQRFFDLDVDRASRHLAAFRSQPFLYYRERPAVLAQMPGVEADYGHTFIGPEYVQQQWAVQVELLGLIPGSLSLLQDILVLRPCS